MDDFDKLPGVVGDYFRRLGRSRRQVIVTLVHHNRPWAIGNYDPFRVLVQVRILRAAETSIHDVERLHFSSERFPTPYARGAREYNTARLGRIHLVAFF